MKASQPPPRLQQDSLSARIFRKEVWERANVRNEHFVGCIVGREGSGKSGTALSIAEALDPTFHASRVCFRPADMLRLIDSDETDQGSVIVLDEAGVGMGARSWYDQAQIKLNKTLQTVRDDNQILLLTLPALSELDSQTQNRLHAYMEMEHVAEGKYASLRFKFLEPARGPDGETYERYPRRRINGRRAKITRLTVGPPLDSIWEEYEERKAEFKAQLYEETIGELEGDDGGDEKSPREIADDILSNGGIEPYTRSINAGSQVVLDVELLASEYDLGERLAKRTKSILLKEVDEDVM